MSVLPETKALLAAEEDESQTPDDAAVAFFGRPEAKIESEALSGTGTVAAMRPRTAAAFNSIFKGSNCVHR